MKTKKTITTETPEELAKRLKREYQRQWRTKNPDKVKANQDNFWLRKAAKVLKETSKG